METHADVIVVGSGASAVHAAYPITEAGRSVILLDVGHEEERYPSLIPSKPFAEIRQTDTNQHRYLLGDNYEGVPLGQLGAGPQITPPRQYVLKDSNRLSPKRSGEFAALESFALGGLAQAWGAVAFPFLDAELTRCGLPIRETREHYERIAQRIGITGAEDDLSSLRGPLTSLQPPMELDQNAARILQRYTRIRDRVHQQQAAVGRAVLALLTERIGDRSPTPYHDMDFWTNPSDSVYRPDLTVQELCRYTNFHYTRPFLVEEFAEPSTGGVQVHARNLGTGKRAIFTAGRLILAAGSFGTTRIVLRSFQHYDIAVPLTCNPHSYIPSLHWDNLGQPPKDRCTSLAQLTVIHDPTGDRQHLVQSQLYSYRSLLLFRLLKESPLAYREGLRILRHLSPAFVIWVMQHEDEPTPQKTCVLRRGLHGGPDVLEVNYRLTDREERACRDNENALAKVFRLLGCLPLKRVHPEHGSSVHYGSQLPFCPEEKPFTTEPTGRLRGTRNVYIGDGAAFGYLPAKGLTFTLMANANRIGCHALND